MNDKSFEFAPPTPPWEPEPEPLELGITTNPEAEKELGLDTSPPEELEPTQPTEEETATLEKMREVKRFGRHVETYIPDASDPEGVQCLVPPQLYNGKPVKAQYAEESEDVNGDELDGFFFYRIKAPQGITLNGTHYPTGAYWFNQSTYSGIEAIDAPFQAIQ